ncbi:MAG: sugar phosphate isomerase/epimerase family protein [Candidatus Hydrogenedentota bacterium]
MKVGMNLLLWTAAADDSHFSLVEDLSKWGFDGVEFPMFAPDCSPWGRYKEHLDNLGMGCTAVGVLPDEASLIDESSSAQENALSHLKASIDSCVEVGAETLAGPIYHPVGALIGRGPNDDERKRCAENLVKLGEHAKGSGVAISVEPLNRFETFFLNCQEDSATLIDAVDDDNIGILYDTFHANIEEKNIGDAIRRGGKRINHVHACSNDRGTPGEDHIPWGETVAALKEIGYDGWLTIEAFGAWLPEIAGATCIWRKMAPSEEHVAREGNKFVREQWAK